MGKGNNPNIAEAGKPHRWKKGQSEAALRRVLEDETNTLPSWLGRIESSGSEVGGITRTSRLSLRRMLFDWIQSHGQRQTRVRRD
jgi:hypothetical protein